MTILEQSEIADRAALHGLHTYLHRYQETNKLLMTFVADV